MFYRFLTILFLITSAVTAHAQEAPDDGSACTNADGEVVDCATGVNLEP